MTREDLDEALLRQSVGSQQARRLNAKERRIVAYHEAGHALCRKLLGLDPPEILSIVPRGPALGFVAHSPAGGQLPEVPRRTARRGRDPARRPRRRGGGARRVLLRRRPTTSTGCTSVCKQMVTEFGMGVALDHDGPPPIALPTGDYAVSDQTRREVDQAAMTLAREAYRRARALLSANREVPRRPGGARRSSARR